MKTDGLADVDTMRQARNVPVRTLADQAIRVVRDVIEGTKDMLAKIDLSDFESTATVIARLSELISTRYISIQDNMSTHVVRTTALVEQLRTITKLFEVHWPSVLSSHLLMATG